MIKANIEPISVTDKSNKMRKVHFEFSDKSGTYMLRTVVYTPEEFKALGKAFKDGK